MKIQYILLELLFKNSTFEIYNIILLYTYMCYIYILIIYIYIPLITCIFLWYSYDLNLQLTDRWTIFFKILILTHIFPKVFYSEKCFRIIIL